METLFLLIGLLSGGAILAFFLFRKRPAEHDLSQRLDSFAQLMTTQMTDMNRRVDHRLKENNQLLQFSQKTLQERMDQSSKVFGKVSGELARVTEEMKRVHDVGKDISTLQEILRAPKLRGILGEFFLEDLLAQYFAKEQYAMQHMFKNGNTVDAVLYVRDKKMVPIDAKFPLENFKRILEVQPEPEREKAKRAFRQDVKKHIDTIAQKYIFPDEGTLNFALMYIPAENVYYEIIVRDRDTDTPLAAYALSHNVFPVSPNTFALYLTTILSGLRGMEIEQRAQDIMAMLERLRGDFGKFEEEFFVLGKHLLHARNSYDTSSKCIGDLGQRLHRIETTQTHKKIPSGQNMNSKLK